VSKEEGREEGREGCDAEKKEAALGV